MHGRDPLAVAVGEARRRRALVVERARLLDQLTDRRTPQAVRRLAEITAELDALERARVARLGGDHAA